MTVYARPGAEGSVMTYPARYDNFIGGEWVAPGAGRYFENRTPVTGEVFIEIARSDESDVEKALDAAHAAAPAPYYLRMELADKPGALAKVATVLGEEGISIDRMRQYAHADSTVAPVLIVTHKCTRDAVSHALSRLPATGVVLSEAVSIRIESV